MIKYFVIRNFRGTCSSVEMLKGYMLIFRNAEGVRAQLKGYIVREKLGTPVLVEYKIVSDLL